MSKKICKGFDDEDKRLYSLSWRLQINVVTLMYAGSSIVLLSVAYYVFHVLKDFLTAIL